MRFPLKLAAIALSLSVALPAHAATVSVAVAANFTKVAEEIAAAFKAKTGDDVELSFGATGQLYTQITQGAPFQVFLAADDQRPQKAVDEGHGVDGTVFTYAVGKLVLYGVAADVTAGADVLKAGDFQKLSIADPETAPYGAAAVETLKSLDLYEALQPKIVTAQNISQAQQFVESGSAELGFVALSQVIGADKGTQWLVPAELYEPIRQDAVLLKTGENEPAARAFLDYLKSDEAVAIIKKSGYEVSP